MSSYILMNCDLHWDLISSSTGTYKYTCISMYKYKLKKKKNGETIGENVKEQKL